MSSPFEAILDIPPIQRRPLSVSLKDPRSNTVSAPSSSLDDAASSISFRSNFSSLYSATTRSSVGTAKLFNIKLEKEIAKQKLMNVIKKEKKEEYKGFFLLFDQFLFERPELADKLFSLCILYISALIHYEKCILANIIQQTNQSEEELEDAKKEVINRLTELSFCYSQILQKHNFRRDTILTFRDTIAEQLFYECLYKMVCFIVLNQFDHAKLQPIIESEIARLFRTKTFSLSRNEKREMRFFIPSEKLYILKQELGVKMSNKSYRRRKASNALNSRSPLITSMLPPFNKNSYSTDKGIDRGIENLRLHIPPEVLFDLTNQEKASDKKEKNKESRSATTKKL